MGQKNIGKPLIEFVDSNRNWCPLRKRIMMLCSALIKDLKEDNPKPDDGLSKDIESLTK